MDFNGEILQKTVELAKQGGAKDIIAKLVQQKEYQIRFSNSAIDISKQWNLNALEIFISKGHKFSVFTIQNPTLNTIKQKITEAASGLSKLPWSPLYWGMDKKSYDYQTIEGLYDSKIENFSDKAPELVNTAIQSSLDAGAKKASGVLYFGSLKTGVLTGYGNGGLYDSSYYRITVRAFVDAESSGQGMSVGRNLSDVENRFIEAGREAGELAKMAVGGKQGKPGKYDVIMSSTVSANVFNHIYDGANPIYIVGGMSCLKNVKKGQQIGPQNLNVSDSALFAEGLNSRPFDFEGTPSQITPIIKNGALEGMIQNTSSAKIWKLLGLLKLKFRTKTKSTGNSYLGGVLSEDIGPRLLAPIPSN